MALAAIQSSSARFVAESSGRQVVNLTPGIAIANRSGLIFEYFSVKITQTSRCFCLPEMINLLLKHRRQLCYKCWRNGCVCLAGLNLRSKRAQRRLSAAHREHRPAVSTFDQSWSMDFVSDSLFNGRRSECLLVGNDPELISKDLGRWVYATDVTLALCRLGKPIANALIESFSGSFA